MSLQYEQSIDVHSVLSYQLERQSYSLPPSNCLEAFTHCFSAIPDSPRATSVKIEATPALFTIAALAIARSILFSGNSGSFIAAVDCFDALFALRATALQLQYAEAAFLLAEALHVWLGLPFADAEPYYIMAADQAHFGACAALAVKYVEKNTKWRGLLRAYAITRSDNTLATAILYGTTIARPNSFANLEKPQDAMNIAKAILRV